jgi:WD40 repeat protein
VNLKQINLAPSNLSKLVFDEAIASTLSITFSPDENLLATGDVNNKIYLWRVADNSKQRVVCKGHIGWVRSVAFSLL